MTNIEFDNDSPGVLPVAGNADIRAYLPSIILAEVHKGESVLGDQQAAAEKAAQDSRSFAVFSAKMTPTNTNNCKR